MKEVRFLRDRLLIPRLIPKELIEQVKGRTFEVETFYTYIEECIDCENPYVLVHVAVDENNVIIGYLWLEINQLDGTLFVNTFSIRKEYWNRGKAIPLAIEFLKNVVKERKCSRVFWITTNEKFFLKKGFKRSKNTLMMHEIFNGEDFHGKAL